MPYNMGEYYERVSDYDLEYQSQSELDIPFWCELVMRYTPRRVLELACGSGRRHRLSSCLTNMCSIVWNFSPCPANEYLRKIPLNMVTAILGGMTHFMAEERKPESHCWAGHTLARAAYR